MDSKKPCKVEGCTGVSRSLGMCSKHYIKSRRIHYTELARSWRKKNPEKVRDSLVKYHTKNKATRNKKCREYVRANQEQIKAWRRSNRPHLNALEAGYRASKRKATPMWADLNKIKEIYEACPKGMQVDHIVPIKGKAVCGFHAEYNLQILPAVENQRKGNRFNET